MGYMFYGCRKLMSLDLSHFDTSNVTDMRWMFYNCSSLTSLDMSHFDTSNVRTMEEMFYYCSNLTTIYCNKDWNEGVCSSSSDMFAGCVKLVGGVGTMYNSNYTDLTYARPDGPGISGYFTHFYSMAISSATVGTLYLDFNAKIPKADHFECYYVRSIDETGTLFLKKVEDVIPAHTAVIIFANKGTYPISYSSEDVTAIEGNLLQGVLEETSVDDLEALHGTDIYVLSRGTDSYVNFYKAGGSVTSIPANRAYLPYTSQSGANALSISFDEDGVESIETSSADNAQKTGIYNLAGQRVSNPKHGLYIVNGKKVFIQ